MKVEMNPIEKRARELSEIKLRTEPVDYERVETKVLSQGNLLDDWISAEYASILDHVEGRGGKFLISEADFNQYCHLLVENRVAWVRNDTKHRIIHPNDQVAHPAFLSVLISNIGTVYDTGLGIEIVPTVDYTLDELAKDKDFNTVRQEVVLKVARISAALRTLGDSGYQYSLGFAKPKTGSWELMAMQLVDNVIKRHDHLAHPVYATMNAVLGLCMTKTVLTPRVRYGEVDRVVSLLQEVTSFGASGKH